MKNNSSTRKEHRKKRAQEREAAMTLRDCGHRHTDAGYNFCKADTRTVQ